jgi:hypothetical protein
VAKLPGNICLSAAAVVGGCMSGLHKYQEAVRDAAEALIEELKTGRLLHNKSALKRRSG